LIEAHSLRVFENRVQRKIFGAKRGEITGNGEDYIKRSFMFSTPHKYYSDDQITKNEVGGACGTYGGEERCIQDFGEET
jgi:hypothetical protein